MISMRSQHASHFSRSFCVSPLSGFVSFSASYRSAWMYVARMTTSSGVASGTKSLPCMSPSAPPLGSRFWMKPLTASAGETSLTARYLSMPQRAQALEELVEVEHRHRVEMPADCAALSWSAGCESMKAILTCGIERRHLYCVLHAGSPVMSDSR